MGGDLGELKVRFTGDASSLSATISSVEAQLAGISGSSVAAGKAMSGAVSGRAISVWTTAGKSIKSVGESVDKLTKPLQTAALVTAAGGVAAAKFAVDFENSFASVEKTVEGTPEQLATIKQGIIDLSTVGIDGRGAIPQSTKELNELAAAGGQLGIETENIVKFTETMAQMGTATNLSGEQGAQTLARFMNVANVAQTDIDRVGSSIVDLGNNFATTESELTQLALRMGATGSVVGISTQDILAYSTALSSMGIEAEAGGSAVSRIWMQMHRSVSEGARNLAHLRSSAGRVQLNFRSNGKRTQAEPFKTF